MARGKGFKTPSLAPRAPHPGFKSGTFYLAGKRNFLLCVDTKMGNLDAGVYLADCHFLRAFLYTVVTKPRFTTREGIMRLAILMGL